MLDMPILGIPQHCVPMPFAHRWRSVESRRAVPPADLRPSAGKRARHRQRLAQVDDRRKERLGWPVARLLREGYGHLRYRKTVLNDRVLTVSLAGIMAAPGGLAAFLTGLDAVPGCGDRQRHIIQAALMTEFRMQAEIAARAGDLVAAKRLADQIETLAVPPVVADDQAPVRFFAATDLEDACTRLWKVATSPRFIYLPETLPQGAKTAPVMACEGRAGDRPATPAFWEVPRPPATAAERLNGLILIDRQVFAALQGRWGRYAALSEAAWEAQRAALARFCTALPAGVAVKLVDFATAHLTACAIIGADLVLPAAGGCAVLHQTAGVAEITACCELAQTNAQDLSEVLGT